MKRPRLTVAEIDEVISAIDYLFAGETSGTSLEGEDESDTERKVKLLSSARAKLDDIALIQTSTNLRRAKWKPGRTE